MFLCRLPSFNELEQHRSRLLWRKWLRQSLPSADEYGYVAERFNLNDLRSLLFHIYGRLNRNKVLAPVASWRLAAIDGHEIGCSYHRCCPQCLSRRVKVGKEERIQLYHRLVAFELLSDQFRLLLDAELVAPGEDEGEAGLRLVSRVLQKHPRCFDVLTADALYLRASTLRLLDSHGKYLVSVLKDNRPDLLRDAQPLFARHKPAVEQSANLRLERWDMEGFQTDWYEKPLRVIRSREIRQQRRRIGAQWVRKQTTHDWWWATTLPKPLAPTATVAARYGHGRWQIENEGFNELVNQWHADHYFHHHPVAIVALWLILFAAHALFHCFWRGNLKTAVRKAFTRIHIARLLAADLLREHCWPVPT